MRASSDALRQCTRYQPLSMHFMLSSWHYISGHFSIQAPENRRNPPFPFSRSRQNCSSPVKAHVGADADTALIEEVAVTPANINDGRAGPDALPDAPGEVFADSAYRGGHFREAVRARGGTSRIAATGMWGSDEQQTLARLAAFNEPIHRVRGRIEKIFGTWK